MTDLEITKLCAKALGIPVEEFRGDDAQAMQLVKKFRLFIYGYSPFWVVASHYTDEQRNAVMADGEDLNRSIFLCVAKMQISNG